MPFGTLSFEAESVPIFSPPYPKPPDPYSFAIDMMLGFTYRVAASQVRHLVPNVLELEDEPLMSTTVLDYGMSPVGAYKEFVHQVEVTYNKEKFMYSLILILDNEAAIFAGREQYGFPKVFGKADIQTANGTRLVLANAQRPAGRTLFECEFIPDHRIPSLPAADKWGLNFRSIPQPCAGTSPAIQELIPTIMDWKFSEIWAGHGQITFPRRSAFDPWCGLDILRYEGSFLARGLTGELRCRGESFKI
ncbi:acetoacetate decarboxylase [Colletotrichum nymphaeae SA-01]|uniref:Acetoacetate decarboxylase n=1 Tax=Colletotrichum nymphaeae SA-01 TaxID=1460502 RepID=A0A135T9Z3_9PEZI|nr:acetoacetate decarboxylase [Colletotrichum nymphaeae SA-01]